MIIGLCGSFAVVPALSMATSGTHATRRLVGPGHQRPGANDPSVSAGALGVAGLVLSDIAVSAASPGGVAVGASAPAPASASASASGAGASLLAGSGSAGSAGSGAPGSAPSGSPPRSAAPGTAPAQPVAARPTRRPGVPSSGNIGLASWLDTIPTGTCANNAAPMGATITVTNAVGVSVTCTVVSRGPFVAGRIVDLAERTFALLGPVSRGLVSVTVTW